MSENQIEGVFGMEENDLRPHVGGGTADLPVLSCGSLDGGKPKASSSVLS